MNETVTVAMATFPPRLQGMLKAVRTLLPQCDRLCLYMNGYTQPPPGLPVSDKLEVVFAGPGSAAPELGSQGKLHWVDTAPGFYLTVDDDMTYPPDYVATMVRAVERYGRKAIVCAHGSVFRTDPEGSPLPGGFLQDQRTLFAYDQALAEDKSVHMPGNACTAYHPRALGMGRDIITGPLHSSDDADVAVWAQRHRVPVIRIATPQRWIAAQPGVGMKDPMHRRQRSRTLKNEKLRGVGTWVLQPLPAPVPGFEAAPAPKVLRPRTVGRVTAGQSLRACGRITAGLPAPVRRTAPKPVAALQPLRVQTGAFTDWEASGAFKATAPVTVAMASFPPRKEGLLRVVSTMLPQCDRLCLYLNGYTAVPAELPQSPKLEIVLAGPGCAAPDKGSQGKHHWLDKYGDSYYLTVDDDILYPPDYVEQMVRAIDRYGRKAIVTVHGTTYRLTPDGHIPAGNLDRFYKTYYSYDKALAEDTVVHCCGNGCTGCYPAAVGITCAVTQGPLHSGDDGDYALWAQAHEIPIVRMRTPAQWLRANARVWPVQAQFQNLDRVRLQDAKARSWDKPWRLFPAQAEAGGRS